jgi:ABC-type Fe3+ transport system substrate-binding protein
MGAGDAAAGGNAMRGPGLGFLLALAATPGVAADQATIDAAKKEGSVTWYTTAIVDQFVRPMVDAFQKKYGVEVTYVRANAAEIALRVVNEGKAGKVQADLIDGTSTSVALRKEDMVAKWTPKVDLPSRYIDKDGYWMATNEYVLTPGYNTELVSEAVKPKTWNDLLDPRWKGKMVWNTSPSSSSGQGFVGLVLMELGDKKGREYLAKLAKQNVTGIKVSARQILDLVIAGEYSIGLQIFNNHATISKSRGAPVGWISMNPALAVLSAMSLTKDAPHPNAGKLLFEFIVSPDGQKIVRDAGELPVSPALEPLEPSLRPGPKTFRAHYLTPEQLAEATPHWTDVYNEYFR